MMATEVRSINEDYTIRGEKITVVTSARFDRKSGAQVFDEKLDNAAINIALDKYRSKHQMITPTRIKKLRHSFGLTQRDFAALLGWSATTIATYETGSLPSKANNKILIALETNPSVAQPLFDSSKDMMTERGKKSFQKNTNNSVVDDSQRLIEKGINELFDDTNYSEYSGFTAFNLKKFSNMVLYFIDHAPEVTKTKLNKLLFYTDFKFFAENTVSMSGVPYARLPHGPVPNDYPLLYGAIESANLIKTEDIISGRYEWSYFIANTDYNASLFTTGELEIMRDTVKRFGKLSASNLSDVSHKENAWKDNAMGDLISYSYSEKLSTL